VLDGEATESSRRSRAVPLDAIPSILVCMRNSRTSAKGVDADIPQWGSIESTLNRPCRRDGGRLSPGGERAFQIFEPAVAVREKCSLHPN